MLVVLVLVEEVLLEVVGLMEVVDEVVGFGVVLGSGVVVGSGLVVVVGSTVVVVEVVEDSGAVEEGSVVVVLEGGGVGMSMLRKVLICAFARVTCPGDHSNMHGSYE